MAKPTSLLKGFERTIVNAKPNGKRQVITDPDNVGLALVISAKGKRTFSVIARAPDNRQVWKTIGPGDMPLDEVRALARQAVARIKSGEEALGLTLPNAGGPYSVSK